MCHNRLLTQMGFKQTKGEHQVRYDDGMTPDQTITDGAEPNSKLTAKMSVPGHLLPARLSPSILQRPLSIQDRLNNHVAAKCREGPIATFCTAVAPQKINKSFRSSARQDGEQIPLPRASMTQLTN